MKVKMKTFWYTLLIICGFMFIFSKARSADHPDIQFNKKLDGNMIASFTGISLDECWKNCEQRAACMSINYLRKTPHLCQLNSVVRDMTLTRQVAYVFLEKPKHESHVECGASACTDGEVCDSQANQCKIKECKPLEDSDEKYIEGNLLATGSERRIGCIPGFGPLHGTKFFVKSVCQNGHWNKLLECIPLTCKRLADAGFTRSDMYKSYDEGSQKTIDIFCDFSGGNGIGYTFLAPNTLNPGINISNYYTRRDHVMLRHVSNEGQFESKMEVLPAYRGLYNVSIFISKHPDFNTPTNVVTKPYMYMGFVPVSFGNHGGKTMGYSCNGLDYIFTNSDGNPNNYFAIFESPQYSATAKKCWGGGGYVHDGWKIGSVSVSPTLPDTVFFDWYEIHMGGGGCLARNCDGTFHGMTFGLPFDY